ncbi:amino acid permease [Ornithinimicrobium sp. INDO-MA30-4]|uniref:amino acid permease n=1 Tax=Ornithinimicrobium sp. INDO-MA30-4 TaxID=2908651 RepID=UPI002882E361|nr:amino acid permease [Ornithinimicrobium sp. INDO-MA30-4]
MPKGIITAMSILLVFAALMLVLVPGAAGADVISTSENPLPEALRIAYGENSTLASFVNYAGLAGLVASFFSIIYAYSRQLFALSRAGYLPRWLSLTGKRKTPWVALIVPGTIGFLLAAITQDGALLINIAVFGATVSYVLLNLSHIMLRRREPDLEREYRTPGGVVTTGVALVLSAIAVVATFVVDPRAAGITALVFAAFIAYFWFYSRHHLVSSAPEEEFDQINSAESDLR